MKKITIFNTLMLLCFFAFAQKESKENEPSITFGIKAGATFSKFSLSNNSETHYTASSLTSFYAGGTVNIPLFSILSIQPGLLFVGKGSNTKRASAPPVSEDGKFSSFYLEIPVSLMTRFELGPGTFFLGGGPYFSFGIGGKVKKTFVDLSGISETEKDANIQFGSDASNDLKKTDFGLNALLGYQLSNGVNIHGGYSFGLANIDPDGSAPSSLKNSVISMGLGYSF